MIYILYKNEDVHETHFSFYFCVHFNRDIT